MSVLVSEEVGRSQHSLSGERENEPLSVWVLSSFTAI